MKSRKPLSPEMKRVVWAPPAANAGAGWEARAQRRGRGFEDSAAAEDFSEAEEPIAVDRFIARGKS